MNEGKVVKHCTPGELFSEDVEVYSLETPMIQKVVKYLTDKGVSLDVSKIKNIKSLVDEIARSVK